MKHIYLLFIMFVFCSCDDFLEEQSQDLIIPKTTADYNELLFGEAYPKEEYLHDYLGVMTDDIESFRGFFGFDIIQNAFGYYTWQKDPEEKQSGVLQNDLAWEKYYRAILTCNIVINTIKEIAGSSTEKNHLLGEAYFLRAYSYFMLVNLYGEPYDPKNADLKLGVPINLQHGVQDVKFQRNSVAEVYERINQDINESIFLLEQSNVKKSFFRANTNAANLLASRIFLYQKKYDKCIEHASKVIDKTPELYDITREINNPFISIQNPEILFTYGKYQDNNGLYTQLLVKAGFKQSSDLMSKYSNEDKRSDLFFKGYKKEIAKSKSDESQGVYGKAFRTAEAYLNRAEAYAELNKIDLATKDINTLRQHRISSDYELTFKDQKEAIKLIRLERRLELCFEEQRWFDLRRYGMPKIEHKIKPTPTSAIQTFILEEKDPAYTLPIPVEVLKFDSQLKNINRPDRKPILNQ